MSLDTFVVSIPSFVLFAQQQSKGDPAALIASIESALGAAIVESAQRHRSQELQKQEARRERPRDTYRSYKIGCCLNVLAAHHRIDLNDEKAVEAMWARYAPTWQIGHRQIKKYPLVASRIPEQVVQAGKAGIETLACIASVENAVLRKWLYELLDRRKASDVQAGAKAAHAAEERELAEEAIRKLARNAMDGIPEVLPGLDTAIEWMEAVKHGLLEGRLDLSEVGPELHEYIQYFQGFGTFLEQLRSGASPVGDRRKTDRDAAGPAPEPEDPRPDAPAPQAAAAASNPAQPERSEAESDAEEAQETEEEPVFVAAPRPRHRSPFERFLPVPYPADDPDPTPAERHACAIVRLGLSLNTYVPYTLNNASRTRDGISTGLILHTHQAVLQCMGQVSAFQRRIKALAGEGEAGVKEHLQNHPDLKLEDVWPLPMDLSEDLVPMTFLGIHILDPVNEPDPSGTEKELWFVLGLMEVMRREIEALTEALDADDVVADDLAYQMDQVLKRTYFELNKLHFYFDLHVRDSKKEMEALAAERELRQQQRKWAEQNLIIVGDDCLPPDYVKVAVTPDGRPIGVSLSRGQVFISLGGQGRGKSHFAILLAEGLLLSLVGLNRRSRGGVPVIFASDWRKGWTRHQHLCGLNPNPYAHQWQWLRERFLVEIAPHMAVFRRAIVLVLPGTQPKYEQMYPDLCERGVEFREIHLHPSEWASFGYKVMLSGSGERLGKGQKPQYQSYLENLVALHGSDRSPMELWRLFEQAKLGGGSKAAIRAQLELMQRLTSKGEHLASVFDEEDALVLTLLESDTLGQDQVLPFQVAMLNAMSKGAPADLPILFALEEVGKQGVSEVIGPYLGQMTRELRHGLQMLVLMAHLSTDLPPEVMTLATGVLYFGGTSPADLHNLQRLCPQFAGRSYREIGEMPKGVVTMGFRESTDPAFAGRAQTAYLRPSCVHAGGETMSSEEEYEDEEEGESGYAG